MKCRLKVLKNKLNLLTVFLPSLESATVSVWIKTGSRNEKDEMLGLSHFLEHMAFKGGKKYPSAKAVSEAIDQVGGEFNASTSKEVTQYYVRIRSKLIKKAFDVLSDIVLQPNLDCKEIKKEKDVIIEEMNMYEDTPVRRIWDLFEQLIFEGHPLGRDIIGTKDTLKKLERGDFISYRNEFYKSGNLLISVAGGFDQDLVEDLADKYFSAIQEGKKDFDLKKPVLEKRKISLTTKDVEQAHMILGFPAEPFGSMNRYKDAVLNAILGSGMSSRLFLEVRERRGLAYAIRSDFERFADAGYFAVYAGVDPNKTQEAIKVILDELYGLASGEKKIKGKELEKGKEYIKGNLALSLEDTRGVSGFFGYEQLMLGRVRSPDEVFENIDRVVCEDIYNQAKNIFRKENLKISIIGPFKNESEFVKILE